MTPTTVETEPLSLQTRFAVALPSAGVAAAVYGWLGTHPARVAAPVSTPLDALIPFVPATVWIYLPGYVAGFLIALLVLPTLRALRAACFSMLAVNLLAAPIYHLHAIAGPRPPAPTGATLTEAFVRWLYAFDPNFNTLPSLHVAQSTLCAVLVSSVSPRWGRLSWVLAVGVWVSTLTLKQHWFVDVPGGLLLAAAGAAIYRAQLGFDPARVSLLLARR